MNNHANKSFGNLNARNWIFFQLKMKITHFLSSTHSRAANWISSSFSSVTGSCVDIVTQTSIGHFLLTSPIGMRGTRK